MNDEDLKASFPCPECGELYSIHDHKKQHVDPSVCQNCVAERRSRFSLVSPGVGSRRSDV